MSKTTKSGNAVTRIVTYILVVLLVLGVAGVIVYLLAKDEGVTFPWNTAANVIFRA